MFVKPADSNTGFLHHIGNADAFETELAKPLGSNTHDPSVRLRLVTLRIAHPPSPSLPESTWIAPGRKARRVSAYSSLIGCKPSNLGAINSLRQRQMSMRLLVSEARR